MMVLVQFLLSHNPLIAHCDAVELIVLILVWFFIYTHALCMQPAKDLASLHIYTGSPEPSFLDTVMNRINIRAPVLLDLLNSLRKTDKMWGLKCSARLAFCLFSPTHLIKSIKHEHSCKILYSSIYEPHHEKNLFFIHEQQRHKSDCTSASSLLREYYISRFYWGNCNRFASFSSCAGRFVPDQVGSPKPGFLMRKRDLVDLF